MIRGSLRATDGKLPGSYKVIKLGLFDGTGLGTVLGNLYGITLGIDVGTDLGSLDGY